MAQEKPPQEQTVQVHDPYALRSLEQILRTFDGGDFYIDLMRKHADLLQQMVEHRDEYPGAKAKGTLSLQIAYDLGKQGDVAMAASATLTPPKKPASSAAAFVDDAGNLTLYSPMMARMHAPPRDVTDYDPETGEIRDA